MDQEKNIPNENQNVVVDTQEPTSNPSVTLEAPKKKKGLGSRIVHSKDTTKLIASLAFCAVFATCTLLAVTVFDKPGHFGDKGADIRMEQRADSDKGSMPDMGSDNRFNGNGFDGRNNAPDGNSGVPSDAQPGDKQDSGDSKSSNSESESGNAGSSDSDKKFNDERPSNPPDQQNTPDDSSSKSDNSNKSTTTYVA